MTILCNQVTIITLSEVAGSCVFGEIPILHDEETIAVQVDVRVIPCLLNAALGEIGFGGANLGPRTNLERVAGAGGPDLLIEQVAEAHALAFESRRVHVGEIVGDCIQRFR